MRAHGSFGELRTAVLRRVTYSTFRQERAVTEVEVNLESDKVHQENRIGQNKTEWKGIQFNFGNAICKIQFFVENSLEKQNLRETL